MSSTIEWLAERGGIRVGIEPRSDGLFQLHLEGWVPGDIAQAPGHWVATRTRTLMTDDPGSARALAEEELAAVFPR